MKIKTTPKSAFSEQRKKQLFFYCLLLFIPVLQFCIFYIGVNLDSILLMLKEYDIVNGYTFSGVDNFVYVFKQIFSTTGADHQVILYSIRNSVILGFISVFIGVSLSVIFSYYIYKKYRGSEIFKVFLFLPNIISSVVLVIMFQKFCDSALPEAINKLFNVKIKGLLSTPDTQLKTLIFYSLWSGFGVQVMMYSGAMSAVSTSITEAAALDRCTPIKEFWYIIVPSIYPTITTFVVVNVATIFVNQLNLFSFYGPSASMMNPEITTIGYYLYKEAYTGELSKLPKIATLGFYMTGVSIPLTFGFKYLMEKFGPSED